MEVHPEDDTPIGPPTSRDSLVPALAVSAVAIVALTAAVMVKRNEAESTTVAAQVPAGALAPAAVVQAPPLKAPDTRSMGGGQACRSCGIVQMVVAVRQAGDKQARGYQMHVRMDDGTVRTIEQRGALPAGSRVLVEGDSVRPLS